MVQCLCGPLIPHSTPAHPPIPPLSHGSWPFPDAGSSEEQREARGAQSDQRAELAGTKRFKTLSFAGVSRDPRETPEPFCLDPASARCFSPLAPLPPHTPASPLFSQGPRPDSEPRLWSHPAPGFRSDICVTLTRSLTLSRLRFLPGIIALVLNL